MKWKVNKIPEFILSKEDWGELKTVSFRDVINGRLFTRSLVTNKLPFIFYLAFLGFFYISNHYGMEESLREIAILNKELKALRYESITKSSELMNMSKQSEVLKRINARQIKLKELTEPPRKLKVKK